MRPIKTIWPGTAIFVYQNNSKIFIVIKLLLRRNLFSMLCCILNPFYSISGFDHVSCLHASTISSCLQYISKPTLGIEIQATWSWSSLAPTAFWDGRLCEFPKRDNLLMGEGKGWGRSQIIQHWKVSKLLIFFCAVIYLTIDGHCHQVKWRRLLLVDINSQYRILTAIAFASGKHCKSGHT